MPTYSATVTTQQPADEVFAYLSDFSTVSEWDPQIDESRRSDAGSPHRVGARFHVTQGSYELEYETTEFDQDRRRVTLHAEHPSLISTDVITVASDAGGTHVTYDADIRWRGWRAALHPAFAVLLALVIGPRAKRGLAKKLDA